MTTHVRTQIRNALATMLVLPTSGQNVFRATGRSIPESQLPAIIIGVGGETITSSTVHGPDVLERDTFLFLKGRFFGCVPGQT